MRGCLLLLLCLWPSLVRGAVDFAQLQTINLGTPPNQSGDTLYRGGQKINENFILLSGWIADLSVGGGVGGTNGVTVAVTNTITGAPGTSAAVANVGSSGQPIFQFTIPAGAPGADGVAGATGLPGAPGLDGTNGLTPAISLTNTITGAAGSAASVVNLGTAIAPLLQFTVPRGASGTNGLNGATGATGPQGLAGVSGTNGLNGINGTNGLNGSGGLSNPLYAYETNQIYTLFYRDSSGTVPLLYQP